VVVVGGWRGGFDVNCEGPPAGQAGLAAQSNRRQPTPNRHPQARAPPELRRNQQEQLEEAMRKIHEMMGGGGAGGGEEDEAQGSRRGRAAGGGEGV
jgi:hypothetical protein